jgi:hypothetical protein
MNSSQWLDMLEYKFGVDNVVVSGLSINADGERQFGKRYKWEDAKFSPVKTFIKHRVQLPFEIILDCEKESQFKYITDFLKKNNITYLAFKANRGHHISTYWLGLEQLSQRDREQLREDFILMLRADMGLKSDKHTIALEFAPHWKSGNIKTLVESYPHGKDFTFALWQINKIEDLIELTKKDEGCQYVFGKQGE